MTTTLVSDDRQTTDGQTITEVDRSLMLLLMNYKINVNRQQSLSFNQTVSKCIHI